MNLLQVLARGEQSFASATRWFGRGRHQRELRGEDCSTWLMSRIEESAQVHRVIVHFAGEQGLDPWLYLHTCSGSVE
jgi:hypothetical protein